jgi:hypothetical protein
MDAHESRERYDRLEVTVTVDHAAIRKWAEDRHGHPATGAKPGERPSAEMLRIEFPDQLSPEFLRKISWTEFFRTFDRSGLAFLYEDEVEDGIESRFYKFVRRNGRRINA